MSMMCYTLWKANLFRGAPSEGTDGEIVVGTFPLHTEKPPYRFPHTAADGLFAEQVAVCAGAGQRQHQNIILYAIDKQPVRENMTFPMTCPIAGQVMVTVLIRQRFAHRQQRYDLLQQFDLQATLDAIQGYKLGILRYIMKEQLEHELPHCMDAVLARYFKHRDVLEMKFVEGKYCVYQDEIVYMESQGHKVNFHLSLGMSVRILTAHTTIDAMQLQLNQNRFVRPHKSFLVNCSYIDKIECGNILLQSGDRITISQSRKKDVDALLTAIL